MSSIIIVGVAGGSGSGKTTFANRVKESLGPDSCSIMGQDSYYKDQSKSFDFDGGSVNFDHPSALDFELMSTHLQSLKKNKTIEIPIYDFASHSRLEETRQLEPKKVILIDGILIFSRPEITKHLDHMLFIDCCEELRFERRLNRDVKERGRTPEGVTKQFKSQVKPMHDEFVEPTKHIACDIVTPENFDQKCREWILSFLKRIKQ